MKLDPTKLVDLEFQELRDLGYTGAMNDMIFKYLIDQGFTGSINDMLYQNSLGGSFSPIDLSPEVWYDPSDATTVTEVSGFVAQVDDKSGNDRHLTQAIAANRPTYTDGAIVYDTTDDFMRFEIGPTTSNLYMAMVCDYNSDFVQTCVMANATNGDFAAGVVNSNTPTSTVFFGTGHTGSPAVRVNGVSMTTHQNVITAAASGDHIIELVGMSGNASDETWFTNRIQQNLDWCHNRTVREMIVLDNPSTADQTALRNYLQTRWGTP